MFLVVFLEFLSKYTHYDLNAFLMCNCICVCASFLCVWCSDRFRYCACLLLLLRPFFFAFRFLVNDRWTLCRERNIFVWRVTEESVKEIDTCVCMCVHTQREKESVLANTKKNLFNDGTNTNTEKYRERGRQKYVCVSGTPFYLNQKKKLVCSCVSLVLCLISFSLFRSLIDQVNTQQIFLW